MSDPNTAQALATAMNAGFALGFVAGAGALFVAAVLWRMWRAGAPRG